MSPTACFRAAERMSRLLSPSAGDRRVGSAAGALPAIDMYLVCIGVVLVCICIYWILIQHTGFSPKDTYWQVLWDLLVRIIPILRIPILRIPILRMSIGVYNGMYWHILKYLLNKSWLVFKYNTS